MKILARNFHTEELISGHWDNEQLNFIFDDGRIMVWKEFKALFNIDYKRKSRAKHLQPNKRLLYLGLILSSKKGIKKHTTLPMRIIREDSQYFWFEPLYGQIKWKRCNKYGKIRHSRKRVHVCDLTTTEALELFKAKTENVCKNCLGAEPYFSCHICRKGKSGIIM